MSMNTIIKQQIHNWKEEMQTLVSDFQFYAGAEDLDRLKALVATAERIAEVAAQRREAIGV